MLAPRSRRQHELRVEIGIASEKGRRLRNEDYVAACWGRPGASGQRGVVAAIADGVGGHKGGREASETAVRAFIDGYYHLPDALSIACAAGLALDAVNGWIAAQARVDPRLAGMATTFTALILAGRVGHIAHVGDTRVYRLGQNGLQRLTNDHTIDTGEVALAIHRAVGLEASLRIDHTAFGLQAQDRFLLCSDGVHGVLSGARLREILTSGGASTATARKIVAAALNAGSTDNVSAIVVDVLDLPPAKAREIAGRFAELPILEPPEAGAIVDNFRLYDVIADGSDCRVFRAADLGSGEILALKFPRLRGSDEASCRSAFVNAAWVAARARNPYIGESIDIAPGRQTRLYSAMPFYDGETLLARSLRAPKLELAEGVAIAVRLARAVAHLHRCGIIHRNIRPQNVVLLKDGGLRLVGLGRSRAAQLQDSFSDGGPDAQDFVAPELLAGAAADERSDLFALGATVHHSFCGACRRGEGERPAKSSFGKLAPLIALRPDLPVWLDSVLATACAPDPADRYGDVLEFAFEIEHGASRARAPATRKKPLYERNPLLFWKGLCGALLALLALALAHR
ncbi:MAG: bifunctional protein-serine/threonine kinase/phosphatase [Roseiarcus sp.]